MYIEKEGNLIKLAYAGEFDVVIHGCNCFCRMKRGIAPQMAEAFKCDNISLYPLEDTKYAGDINKLGQMQFNYVTPVIKGPNQYLKAVNCYTQYHWDSNSKPFDYFAFILCCKKLNHIFKGLHIGMPQIGCGLAGGDWVRVKDIIQKELINVDVTVVMYKP